MSKMFQFSLISLFLSLSGLGTIIGAFILSSVASVVILLIISACLILAGLYLLIYALAFNFGKKVKAKITNKVYIAGDNDEHISNSYYRYEYAITLKGKVKKGKFRIYYTDQDISSTLNIGDEIEVNKFLFVTNVDSNEIINEVRQVNKNNLEFQQKLIEKNKFVNKNSKRDMIVGICILALIGICYFIYVFSIMK